MNCASPHPSNNGPIELDKERIEQLLDLLDERLRARNIAASVYVVGGAAIALSVNAGRRSLDVDGIVSDDAVLEEARKIAEEQGLPPNWLNSNVLPWVPPRPDVARRVPEEPGLVRHIASPRHLLAMKLVALRRQDTPDILALVRQLDLTQAPATAFAELLSSVYDGGGQLGQMLGVPDDGVWEEAVRIGEWVQKLVDQGGDESS